MASQGSDKAGRKGLRGMPPPGNFTFPGFSLRPGICVRTHNLCLLLAAGVRSEAVYDSAAGTALNGHSYADTRQLPTYYVTILPADPSGCAPAAVGRPQPSSLVRSGR